MSGITAKAVEDILAHVAEWICSEDIKLSDLQNFHDQYLTTHEFIKNNPVNFISAQEHKAVYGQSCLIILSLLVTIGDLRERELLQATTRRYGS